jgi:hypothetical protein
MAHNRAAKIPTTMSDYARGAEADRLIDQIREVTGEIDKNNDLTQELKAYRVELCRQAREVGVTTRRLGQAANVSGVAVTLWLQAQAQAQAS